LTGYLSRDVRGGTFDETREGGVASIGHRFRNRWYGQLSSRTENVEISNLDSDAPQAIRELRGSTFLEGVKVMLVRDRTDSRWLASTGDRLRLSFEQVLGDFAFQKVQGAYSIFQTLHVDPLDRKHILALRLSAGKIFNEAPTFERFYAGGTTTIRGFRFRGVSPRSGPADEAIGGDFRFLAGTEYSYPIIGQQMRGVLFVDSGTVHQDIEIAKYRVAAGFGFRWIVPLLGPVPIRFDFGFPLSADRDDDKRMFSFSLGWRF
jgi:outer membrane protein insertion porin family